MGTEALRALTPDRGFSIAAVLSREPGIEVGGCITVSDLDEVLDRVDADVLLELSHADCAADNAVTALRHGVRPVIGVSGLSDADVDRVREAANSSGALLVPNFALGAVLMIKFSEMAARWLPNAEIVERHHEKKVDAPSGTALETAKRIVAHRGEFVPLTPGQEKLPAARGADANGVPIHSLRLPGSLAHQETIFGGTGETLVVAHHSLDRSSFAQGMRLCCERVKDVSGLVIGMDALLYDDRS